MKIKFTYTFDIDLDKFPNLTATNIREEFLSTALSYMQHVEEETLNFLSDENSTSKPSLK